MSQNVIFTLKILTESNYLGSRVGFLGDNAPSENEAKTSGGTRHQSAEINRAHLIRSFNGGDEATHR
ncbi:MAG: hypothetical protein RJA41_317 [Actinomycetota bacterium]|jgi:hypothetical protein